MSSDHGARFVLCPSISSPSFFKARLIRGSGFKLAIFADVGRCGAAAEIHHPRHNIRPYQHIPAITGDKAQAVRERRPHIRQREDRRYDNIASQGRACCCLVRLRLGAGSLALPSLVTRFHGISVCLVPSGAVTSTVVAVLVSSA